MVFQHPFGPGRIVLATAAVFFLCAASAEAIPAFARKYESSCQTCHIAFPKLNPFGEAFRLRGYRMPAETENMIRELRVPLGAPAYKQVWPDAVWPSDIPGTIPLSLAIDFASLSRRTAGEADEGHSETIKNDFRFPQEIGFFAGGTLGETLSFLSEVAFEPEVEDGHEGIEIEIEHGQLNFNGPWGSGTAFNVKVGRFAPEITQPFGHSALLTSSGPTTVLQFVPIAAHGGSQVGGHHADGIALPHSVDGIEAYGILARRLLYSGGFSNGLGPGAESVDGNSAKDVYGRVAYKFGGLPLDGEGYVPSDEGWRETSLRLGGFAYRGDGSDFLVAGTGHHGDELLEDRDFTRVGVDASLFVRDLNLVVGFVRGRDALATYEEAHAEHDEAAQGDEVDEHNEPDARRFEFAGVEDFTYKTWFVEADYVFMPWLHGAVRYEWLDPANGRAPDIKRIVPNATALIRANVKASLEYLRDVGDRDDYVLAATLAFAF